MGLLPGSTLKVSVLCYVYADAHLRGMVFYAIQVERATAQQSRLARRLER